MGGTHALFAPSKGEVWVNCHAALAAAKGLPPEEAGEEAARGSVKHWISEQCLTHDIEPESFLKRAVEQEGFKFTIDDSYVEQVHGYIDAIRREPADEKHFEVKLDSSAILTVPGQGGTADCVMLKYAEQQLEVHDAKFGYHRVMATGNEQLLMYASAALAHFDLVAPWQTIKVAIHQPSIDHYDECIYTRDAVIAFAQVARTAAQVGFALYNSGTPEQIRGSMNPGPKQCHWCPARAGCPARAEAVLNMFKDTTAVPKVGVQLSDAELAIALQEVPGIQHWCADVEIEANRRAKSGGVIPGYKLIRGKRGKRFWADALAAKPKLVALLKDQAYEPVELISPTAAEKLLKEKYVDIKAYVGQNEGQVQLVPESAKGDAVTITPVEFQDHSAESLL